jgi:DnaJ-class molecular chaperone
VAHAKTPKVPTGSGEFLRDQSANGVRQLCETLRECPKCKGRGELRKVTETATTYHVTIDPCAFCEGLGCVPKYRVA